MTSEGSQPRPEVVEDATGAEVHSAEVVEPALGEDEAGTQFVEAFIAAQFSGPLPPPDILRAYDDVVDHGAERIFRMWEGETEHRQGLESRQLDGFLSGTTRAQWMAFSVILAIGLGGLVLVVLGYSLIGLAGFILALASVAASFYPRLKAGKAPAGKKGSDG